MKKSISIKVLCVGVVTLLMTPMSYASQEEVCQETELTWPEEEEVYKYIPCSSIWDYRTENTEEVRDPRCGVEGCSKYKSCPKTVRRVDNTKQIAERNQMDCSGCSGIPEIGCCEFNLDPDRNKCIQIRNSRVNAINSSAGKTVTSSSFWFTYENGHHNCNVRVNYNYTYQSRREECGCEVEQYAVCTKFIGLIPQLSDKENLSMEEIQSPPYNAVPIDYTIPEHYIYDGDRTADLNVVLKCMSCEQIQVTDDTSAKDKFKCLEKSMNTLPEDIDRNPIEKQMVRMFEFYGHLLPSDQQSNARMLYSDYENSVPQCGFGYAPLISEECIKAGDKISFGWIRGINGPLVQCQRMLASHVNKEVFMSEVEPCLDFSYARMPNSACGDEYRMVLDDLNFALTDCMLNEDEDQETMNCDTSLLEGYMQ